MKFMDVCLGKGENKMDMVTTVCLYALFSGTFIWQVWLLKDLLIPTKKGKAQIFFTLVGAAVILGLTYFYGNNLVHYGLGLLALAVIAIYPFTSGITADGLSYKRGSFIALLAPWQKIKRVRVKIKKEAVVVSFSGGGYDDLYFDQEEYEQLMKILTGKLPAGVLKTSY